MNKEPLQAEINIGLVGHVDHGKTTLTKLLTGKWTDTHSEELKKGISIRLGYADTVFRKCVKCKGAEGFTVQEKCPNCEGKTEVLRKVSFVDAPGHEILMTTMLSGAALMNGAILVIAANEKAPQPRTAEHLMALEISGIKNIVVAQNKIDLVDKKRAIESFNEIKQFLKDYGYEKVPVIPVAANFGINLDLLIEAIEENIKTPEYDLKKPVKMFVAKSFDVNRPGTMPEKLIGAVMGGSISQGKLKIGEKLEMKPGIAGKGIEFTVESLSTEKAKIKEALPGGLIAVGTILDPSLGQNEQLRGQVLGAIGSLPEPVEEISLEVHMLPRILTNKNEKIKVNEQLIVTLGTNTAVGMTVKEKGNEITVRFKSPVVVEKNQKVALSKRIDSAWRLIAYGINK